MLKRMSQLMLLVEKKHRYFSVDYQKSHCISNISITFKTNLKDYGLPSAADPTEACPKFIARCFKDKSLLQFQLLTVLNIIL